LSLILREEYRLRVFENRVLFAKYNYSDDVEEYEMGEAYRTNMEKMNAYRLLVGKSEGGKPPGKQKLGGWILSRLI
jgi:hypothetical protein